RRRRCLLRPCRYCQANSRKVWQSRPRAGSAPIPECCPKPAGSTGFSLHVSEANSSPVDGRGIRRLGDLSPSRSWVRVACPWARRPTLIQAALAASEQASLSFSRQREKDQPFTLFAKLLRSF